MIIGKIKREEVVSRLFAGERLLVGEYLGAAIKTRPAKADASKVSVNVNFAFLFGTQTVEITEFLPDGTDPKAVKLPDLKPRASVVLAWDTIERTQYGVRARGDVFELAA